MMTSYRIIKSQFTEGCRSGLVWKTRGFRNINNSEIDKTTRTYWKSFNSSCVSRWQTSVSEFVTFETCQKMQFLHWITRAKPEPIGQKSSAKEKTPRRLRLGGFAVFIDAGCRSGVKGRVRNWFCFSKRHHDWSLWHHGHQPVQCGNSRRHAGGYFSSQLRSRTTRNEIYATPSGPKWTCLGTPPPVGRTATPWRGPFALVIFGCIYGSPSGHKTQRHSRHAPPSATAYGLAPNGWRGPHEPQPERVAPLATPLRRHEWHVVIASADGPPSSAPSTAPPAAPPPPASPSSPRWSSPPWS